MGSPSEPLSSTVIRPAVATTRVHPLSLRRQTHRPSVGDLTWESWWRGFKASTRHASHPRFSADKARKFIAYRRDKSTFHQTMVLLLFPVPGLLAALIAPLIPLQDPSEGILRNRGFIAHGFVAAATSILGAMMQTRAVAGISHREFSNVQLGLVTAISTPFVALSGVVLAVVWRFPVPFLWLQVVAPYLMFGALATVMVLRSQLRQSRRLLRRLLFALPQLCIQLGQLVLYSSYSAIFHVCNEWQQLLLIVIFPLLKMGLKRLVVAVSHHLSDYARENATSGIEISASMYQAMVMQSTPTPLATALVVGFDLLQGGFSLTHFMERPTIIPKRDLLETAIQILQTNRNASWAGSMIGINPVAIQPETASPSKTGSQPSGISQVRALNQAILTQALELLQSAETILLVEYIEVAVPTTNAVFLCIASQLQTALFNPQLRKFYGNYSELRQAVGTMMLYICLQGVTLLLMCLVMRVRYRVSAFTLLAFVLEYHSWSLHGKMIAWLAAMLEFSVVHYGVDFTFKFDFTDYK